MGVIPNSIPDQAFEIVRDRIGAIIADELQQQSAINYDDDLTAPVWMERISPFNYSETTHGAINIQLEGSNYDGETQATQYGTTNFSIYFYFSAKSSAEGIADKRAKFKLARLMGVVRGILMDSRYNRLGFEGAFITNRRVVDMAFGDPINSQDGSSVTVGRINFAVRVNENVALSSVRVLDGYGTQVTLSDTDLGYVYGISDLPAPSPACAPVSIKVNSVSFATVTSGATFDITLVGSDLVPVTATISGSSLIIPPVEFSINGTSEETLQAGENLPLILVDQDGNTPTYVYDEVLHKLTVQSGGSASIDIAVNGTPFYTGVSTNQDLPVKKSDAATNVGSKVGANWIIGDTSETYNGAAITGVTAEGFKDIVGKDSAGNDVGTVTADTEAELEITIANSTVSNSDDTYTASVLAQGSLELPDETFYFQIDGVTVATETEPALSTQTFNINWN